MKKLANFIRHVFTPETGARARNLVRSVVPALVVLKVPGFAHLDGTQVAAIAIATEAIFAGGGVVADRTTTDTPNQEG